MIMNKIETVRKRMDPNSIGIGKRVIRLTLASHIKTQSSRPLNNLQRNQLYKESLKREAVIKIRVLSPRRSRKTANNHPKNGPLART
jgi:hypothetical protein